MGLTITSDEFRLLKELIEKECGIEVKEDKIYLIENRLTKLVIENGCDSFGEFYLKAKTSPNPALRSKIVDAITTNETLWFRDEAPFNVLKEVLLPRFWAELDEGKRSQVRIWSAACSTGQEPYSIAMIIDDFCKHNPGSERMRDKISIYATDISSSALLLAKSARYDAIAMSRGMIPEFRERYFEDQGRVSVLREDIREMVTFEQFNLQNSFAALGAFDVVLLRNVAIYFSVEFKTELFQKVARVLESQGVLIVGSSEILTGYTQDFEKKEHSRGIYYQLKCSERVDPQ